MSTEIKKEIQLEIGHVLFIDIVGYSVDLVNGGAHTFRHKALQLGLHCAVTCGHAGAHDREMPGI